ncbi:MAG TPA: DEAD/DEAH box helicase [Bacillota bacterium]|nr:DEAD/DEAH box helicase [Bacillota bacterium]
MKSLEALSSHVVKKGGDLLLPTGRVLLEEELERIAPEAWREEMKKLSSRGKVKTQPGVDLTRRTCNRCGGMDLHFVDCGSCRKECAYCTSCLQMGRSKTCTPLYYIEDEEEERTSLTHSLLAWKGNLTPSQLEASDTASDLVRKTNQKCLIWAVCGAGKTEVTFKPIDQALQLGQKVLIATPRKDVVLELFPRIQQAFPTVRVIALHGKSAQKWEEAQITISTTHQVLRFYQKFDLVVIDEVDAYPYHNNPMLYFAVERARKPSGNLLYLSATPPDYLRKLPQVRIPARYHRKPLAVPQIVLERNLAKRLKKITHLDVIHQIINYIFENQRQGFFFVPYIGLVEELVNQLNHYDEIEGTHSRDPAREEKVRRFREGEIRILVTTTILERGVTVPKTDVIVIQADSSIFDEASLVQMSGRAGRSLLDPVGTVVFIAEEKTREMKKAIKHIKQMNKWAKKRGLLDC